MRMWSDIGELGSAVTCGSGITMNPSRSSPGSRKSSPSTRGNYLCHLAAIGVTLTGFAIAGAGYSLRVILDFFARDDPQVHRPGPLAGESPGTIAGSHDR